MVSANTFWSPCKDKGLWPSLVGQPTGGTALALEGVTLVETGAGRTSGVKETGELCGHQASAVERRPTVKVSTEERVDLTDVSERA